MSENKFYDIDLSETISKNRLLGLWRMMRGYRLLYIGATLTLAVATISRTGVNLVLRRFIDNVIIAGNYGTELVTVIGLFIALALTQGGFTFISGWMTSKASESITRRLRNYLFDHLQRLPYASSCRNQTGI